MDVSQNLCETWIMDGGLAGVRQCSSAQLTRQSIWTTPPPTLGSSSIMPDTYSVMMYIYIESEGKLWVLNTKVVYPGPGDFMIQPPGQVHGIHIPKEGFMSGVSFFNLISMHHTERAWYMDCKKAKFLTNQTHAYSYALETMQRVAISIPHLSTRIKTVYLSEGICKDIMTFLGIKNVGSLSTTLYREN
ncbi:hypothetical protein EDB19DRAFT_1831172 [Suillus lakei]|nr:hypothetical protein EDB19DRAFT_1831172 [Suillus lakei]